MYQSWEDFWNKATDKLEEHDIDPRNQINVFNGDMVDGDHHGTAQIASRNMKEQHQIAADVLMYPMLMNPQASTFFISGTESHVGKQAEYEELLAQDFEGMIDPETGNYSSYHRRMEVGGLLFDFQHHGRAGYRPWTKGSNIALLAAEITDRHLWAGERNPDFAIRSHVHQFADSGNAAPTRAVTTPAWQLKSMFAHRVAAESLSSIGGLLILVGDGYAHLEPVIYRASQPKVWRPDHEGGIRSGVERELNKALKETE